jgi:hypothetical protein
MPSTERKLELKAKTSVAQTGSQPFVYAKGLIYVYIFDSGTKYFVKWTLSCVSRVSDTAQRRLNNTLFVFVKLTI